MGNGWKVTGIVFLSLFIIESLLLVGGIVWLFGSVYEDMSKEDICITDICANTDSYSYYEGVCECFEIENQCYKLVKTEYIE